jgi:ribonuclease D
MDPVVDAGALADLVERLVDEPVYGLDTEFHRERTYHPHLALVQIAWDGGVALIDPLAVDVAPLAKVLDGPGVAVLHAADQDLEVLDRACGTVPATLFDTQLAASFAGFSTPSLTRLTEALVGVRLPKGDRLTDWTLRPLTDDQKTYAASDVTHLLDLHRILAADLEARGRLAWALDECELLRRRRNRTDPDTAWWRLKDSRSLRGKSRGVAQAVAAWRERRASETDRPTRTILPDLGLLGIANRPPKDVEDLRRVRGLDERHTRGAVAREILDAVNVGLSLPPEQLRVPPVDELERELRPAVALASAWVAQLAKNLEIDATLLGTRTDLQALLRGDGAARLATGWRAELVGEPIRRLVDGEAALAFDGKGGLVLEPRFKSA